MTVPNNLVQKAKDFIEISQILIKKGYKKKDIANLIELPASVFSSLYRTVFPKIIKIDELSTSNDVEIQIDNAFKLVNNLSKSRIVKGIDKFVHILKTLPPDPQSDIKQFDYFMNLKKNAESNFEYISNYYKGLYYFYYLSTDHYCIKRDVFMVKPNSITKTAECFKGNKNSKVEYFGIATLVGTHTLNFHMSEKNISPSEYILMNLSLPSIRNVEFYRGVFNGLTYSRQPIGRKFILTKISNETNENEFQNIEMLRYEKSALTQIQEISNYLLDSSAKTECHLVTSPSFNVSDLEKELKINKNVN